MFFVLVISLGYATYLIIELKEENEMLRLRTEALEHDMQRMKDHVVELIAQLNSREL